MRYVLLIGLLFFVVFLVLAAIILGAGIGVGWLLTRFLPFTLFEGAVLGVLAVSVAGATTWRFFRSGPSYPDDELFFDDEDFDLDDLPPGVIHPSRFIEDEADRTWENWFHYLFANDIYRDLTVFDEQVVHMNDMQKQELAIRLAEVIVAILRAKPPSTRRLRITKEQVRRKLTKMGMRPYDDDIIELALNAVEDNLDTFEEQILYIIRTKSWDDPSEELF
ncbi:MAG TPA: hypothetical protein G4N94_03130 [Caldilineae bacterium]|nr:hypothetical protein [Caldilineae bacterium]